MNWDFWGEDLGWTSLLRRIHQCPVAHCPACCRLLCCRNVLAEMFLQASSTGNPQTASGGPCQLRGPPAARGFAVTRAQVFPLSCLCCQWGENSSPLLWQTCFGTVRMCEIDRMGCYAIPCWVIVTTSADPEWPVAEDCCLSPPPALCHPRLLLSCFQSASLKKKTNKQLAKETCTTGYLMQILLNALTHTYSSGWW